MSRICQVTGKKPMHGNKRSHAMNASKRWFIPNIHKHRFWSSNQKRFYSIRVSTKGIRLVDKLGIDQFIASSFKKKN